MNKMLSTYGRMRLPFSKALPASEMLDTEALQTARERLKAALEGRASAVVTGDSGPGKPCLLRAIEEDLPQGRYRIHYVQNATVNRRDFYRQLSIGMGLEPLATCAALFASISQHIEDQASQHKLRVVLLLDEAHLLPLQVLDQLHILLNYQRDSKPWLSIILVGLPELRETLKRNVLQSLTGRIPIRIHIPPLDSDQVKQYVRHRMTAAGCRREVFADDGLLLISKATGGIMRRIDVLAARCLEVAGKGKSNLVDATVAEAAIRDCAGALLLAPPLLRWPFPISASSLPILCASTASPIKSGSRPRSCFTARLFSSSIPWSAFTRLMKMPPVRSPHCSVTSAFCNARPARPLRWSITQKKPSPLMAAPGTVCGAPPIFTRGGVCFSTYAGIMAS